MDEDQEKGVTCVRRHCERVLFKYQVVLELSGGKNYWGITRDVSLRGLFVNLTGTPVGIKPGNQGFLRLTVLNLQKRFPCRVVYVTNQGIGLELFDKEENFGAALTASLMQDTLFRLGADVNAVDSIRVALRSAPFALPDHLPEFRLAKISMRHMECRFSQEPGWSMKPGDALLLEIRASFQPPIEVEGVVRSVLLVEDDEAGNDQDVNQRLVSMVFAVMPDDTVKAIKDLMRTLHARRLRQMMTCRATSIGLQSGPDQAGWTRPEVRRDLVRFFGPRS